MHYINWSSAGDYEYMRRFKITSQEDCRYAWIEENEPYFQIREHYSAKQRLSGIELKDELFYYYSKKEILDADYCILKDHFGCGYPEPFLFYDELVFDCRSLCEQCCIEPEQIYDFRVKAISSHGLWGFFANLPDVLFASTQLYNEVFAPLGIEHRPVRTLSGEVRKDVTQLIIPVIDEGLNLSDYSYELCPLCGKRKYCENYVSKPFFPLHKHPLPYLYYSKESFGTVRRSYRQIFISRELVAILLDNKLIKTDWLIPCKNVQNTKPVPADKFCTDHLPKRDVLSKDFGTFSLFYNENTPHVWKKETLSSTTVQLYSNDYKNLASIWLLKMDGDIVKGSLDFAHIRNNGLRVSFGENKVFSLIEAINILKENKSRDFSFAIEECLSNYTQKS